MKALYDQQLVDELRNKCNSIKERLWISSPYLGKKDPMFQIIGDKWKRDENVDFKLLVDYSNYNNCNFDTLNYLLNLKKQKFEIKSLQALHAKIYIFDNECLVTSANLTPTAFRCRYEIGLFLDKKESIEVIKVFENFWKLKKCKSISKIKKSKKVKPIIVDGEEFSNGFESRNKLPEYKNEESQGWLKILGYSDSKFKEDEFEIDENSDLLNISLLGTPRGSSLKENDTVILMRMINYKSKKYRIIYGRAKVDIPGNKSVLNLSNYIGRFKKNISIDKKKRALYSIKQWKHGFWIKDLELIFGKIDKQINFYDLKDLNGNQLIKPTSISHKSHIRLKDYQMDVINMEINNRLPKKSKKVNPQGIWLNDVLEKKYRIMKNDFRKKD